MKTTITMSVFVNYHPDRTPWKTWCIGKDGKQYVVRFGPYNGNLQERVLEITWDESQKRQKAKLSEGYEYQGEFRVSNEVLSKVEEKPTEAKVKSLDLVHWKATNPVQGWSEMAAQNLGKLFDDVSVHEENGHELLLIPSISFRYGYETAGISRGIIAKEEMDGNQMVALLTISNCTPIEIVDDDGNSVSTKRFMSDMKHLKFESMSFMEFEKKLKDVDVIKPSPLLKMRGAAAFL